MIGTFVILLGLISFFVGYFFLGKSKGQEECNKQSANINYIGGLAGIIIGVIFMFVGLIVNYGKSSREAKSYK
jgi:amino acid transporter